MRSGAIAITRRVAFIATLLGATVAHAEEPQRFEVPWAGATFELKFGTLEVVAVAPRSIARMAGLHVHHIVLALGSRSVSGLSAAVIQRELDVPPGDTLQVYPKEAGTLGWGAALVRPGTLPPLNQEFPWDQPLSEEQLDALPSSKRERYQEFTRRKTLHSSERLLPPRSVRARLTSPTALVYAKPLAREPTTVRAGDIEKGVLLASVHLEASCDQQRVTGVSLESPLLPKPRALELAKGLEAEGHLLATDATLPLWKADPTKEACDAGHVHAAPITVTLTCADGQHLIREVDVPVELRCDGDEEAVGGRFANRQTTVTPRAVRRGVAGEVEACVMVRVLGSPVVKATPVLLDEHGAVGRRFDGVPLLPPGEHDEVRMAVSLPTEAEGTLHVAFEAQLLDGTTVLSKPRDVSVR